MNDINESAHDGMLADQRSYSIFNTLPKNVLMMLLTWLYREDVLMLSRTCRSLRQMIVELNNRALYPLPISHPNNIVFGHISFRPIIQHYDSSEVLTINDNPNISEELVSRHQQIGGNRMLAMNSAGEFFTIFAADIYRWTLTRGGQFQLIQILKYSCLSYQALYKYYNVGALTCGLDDVVYVIHFIDSAKAMLTAWYRDEYGNYLLEAAQQLPDNINITGSSKLLINNSNKLYLICNNRIIVYQPDASSGKIKLNLLMDHGVDADAGLMKYEASCLDSYNNLLFLVCITGQGDSVVVAYRLTRGDQLVLCMREPLRHLYNETHNNVIRHVVSNHCGELFTADDHSIYIWKKHIYAHDRGVIRCLLQQRICYDMNYTITQLYIIASKAGNLFVLTNTNKILVYHRSQDDASYWRTQTLSSPVGGAFSIRQIASDLFSSKLLIVDNLKLTFFHREEVADKKKLQEYWTRILNRLMQSFSSYLNDKVFQSCSEIVELAMGEKMEQMLLSCCKSLGTGASINQLFELDKLFEVVCQHISYSKTKRVKFHFPYLRRLLMISLFFYAFRQPTSVFLDALKQLLNTPCLRSDNVPEEKQVFSDNALCFLIFVLAIKALKTNGLRKDDKEVLSIIVLGYKGVDQSVDQQVEGSDIFKSLIGMLNIFNSKNEKLLLEIIYVYSNHIQMSREYRLPNIDTLVYVPIDVDDNTKNQKKCTVC